MGVMIAVFQLGGMLAAVLGTRRAPTTSRQSGAGSLLTALAAARQNPWFLRLWGCFVVQALASAATLAAIPYFATYILQRPSATTPIFASLVAPAILVMPFWTKCGRRWGKKRAYVVASLIYAAASAGLLAGRVLPFACVLLLVVGAGIGYSGMQVFPLAMLPDTISVDEARCGVRRAGLLTGLWTAGETGAFALGPSLVGVVLAWGGFVSSSGQPVWQPPGAYTAILLAFGALPAAGMLLSLLVLWRYDLSATRLRELTG